MCNSTPRRPTAKEAAAIAAGPTRNRMPMAKVATLLPQAMMRGCKAMNNPVSKRMSSKDMQYSLRQNQFISIKQISALETKVKLHVNARSSVKQHTKAKHRHAEASIREY